MSFIIQTSGASAPGTQVTAVASGALAAGDIVVANANGTVSKLKPISGSTITLPQNTQNNRLGIVYDVSQSKSVVVGQASGGAIIATVITSTGTTVSAGTGVTVASAVNTFQGVVYDANAQKIVVIYKNISTYGVGIVGTVSGTTISFGSPVVWWSDITSTEIGVGYDATAQKIMVAFLRSGSGNQSLVLTVSGTSISAGASYSFNTAGTSPMNIKIVHDANAGRNVMVWSQDVGSYAAQAVVATISGTAISFGTTVTIETDTGGSNKQQSIVYSSVAQKVIVNYQNTSTGQVRSAVGTVSGTSISFGTIVSTGQSSSANFTTSYDPNVNQVIHNYVSGSDTVIVRGTVSGTSISYSSPNIVATSESLTNSPGSSTYDNSQQTIVITGVGQKILGVDPAFVELTSENFIGFSDNAYLNGETATINCIGTIQDTFVGLTPGQAYYCLQNNTISQTPGSPSVFAGTCFATDKIIVKG